MRLPSTERTEANITPTGGFVIKASAKAFMMLSAKLYKYPIRAICREICTNAIDAHIAAGIPSARFDVALPSTYSPVFSVRDYGLGLSEDDIKNLFTVYFESTKADSDDFTGALGLGCKSPFGYTNAFTVISYFEGVKSTYSMYTIDSFPQYKLLKQEKSSEPSGIHVIVPVKPQDTSLFINEAWAVMPPLMIRPRVDSVDPDKAFDYVKIDAIGNGGLSVYHFADHTQSQLVLGGRNNCGVAQGGVVYPIDFHMIESHAKKMREDDPDGTITAENIASIQLLQQFLGSALNGYGRSAIINVPIGTVNFLPNREELSYDVFTISNLATLADKLTADLVKEAKDIWNPSRPPMERVEEFAKHATFSKMVTPAMNTPLAKTLKPLIKSTLDQLTKEWKVANKVPTDGVTVQIGPYTDPDNKQVVTHTINMLGNPFTCVTDEGSVFTEYNLSMISGQLMLLPANASISAFESRKSSRKGGVIELANPSVRRPLSVMMGLLDAVSGDRALKARERCEKAKTIWSVDSEMNAMAQTLRSVCHHLANITTMHTSIKAIQGLGYSVQKILGTQDAATIDQMVASLKALLNLVPGYRYESIMPLQKHATTLCVVDKRSEHSETATLRAIKRYVNQKAIVGNVLVLSGISADEYVKRCNPAGSKIVIDPSVVVDIEAIRAATKAVPLPKCVVQLDDVKVRVWNSDASSRVRQLKNIDYVNIKQAAKYAVVGDYDDGEFGFVKQFTRKNKKEFMMPTTPNGIIELYEGLKKIEKFVEWQKANPGKNRAPQEGYEYRAHEIVFFSTKTYATAVNKGMKLIPLEVYVKEVIDGIDSSPELLGLIASSSWGSGSSIDYSDRSGAREITRVLARLDQSKLPTAFADSVKSWDAILSNADVFTQFMSKKNIRTTMSQIAPNNMIAKEFSKWVDDYPLLSGVLNTKSKDATLLEHLTTYINTHHKETP